VLALPALPALPQELEEFDLQMLCGKHICKLGDDLGIFHGIWGYFNVMGYLPKNVIFGPV
jgi:hypothetical protein